jgi:hypothetical protein
MQIDDDFQAGRRKVKKFLQESYHDLLAAIPVKVAIQIQYFRAHRRFANFERPTTFTEKIQARKIAVIDPRHVRLSDKIEVKSFVLERVGAEVVTPTLWSGTELPEVPPNEWGSQFVVKANHASGWNAMIANIDSTDWRTVTARACRWPNQPWDPFLHEHWYNLIDRKILVEPMMGDGAPLNDYKFFVFDGKVAIVQVDTDRFTLHKRSFYDTDWVKQPISFKFPLDERDHAPPRNLDRMIEIAEALGAGFDFVRVDLYDLPEGPRFGEMTFSPESGFGRFSPSTVDADLGRLWRQSKSASDQSMREV